MSVSGTTVRGLLSKILVLNDTLEKMSFSVVLLEEGLLVMPLKSMKLANKPPTVILLCDAMYFSVLSSYFLKVFTFSAPFSSYTHF